jgi:hypothetical protein
MDKRQAEIAQYQD